MSVTKKEKDAKVYQEYMRSPAWRDLREKILRRDGYTCQYCEKAKAVTVHHWRYDNVFNEKPAELTSLCWECHKALHPKKDSFWIRGEDIPNDAMTKIC